MRNWFFGHDLDTSFQYKHAPEFNDTGRRDGVY